MTTHPNANPLTLGRRYRIPSGMGGSFDAVLLSITDESGCTLRVDEPRNPDWHRYVVTCDPADVRPIPQLFEVRTRCKGPDHLTWGRYPTQDEATTAKAAAEKYPACHPVRVVKVEG